MYSNEEKIFQAQLNSIRLDSEERKFDFDGEQQRSRETLEEDFAFRERFLVQKIADLQRVARESESESEDPELLETEAELADQREVLATALDELNRIRSEFLANENARVNSESDEVRAKREQIRLIFLQTDEPFQNTSLTLAVRNIGTPIRFATDEYPLPAIVSLGLSYTLLNVDNHVVRLSTQADLPLQFTEGIPFYQDISIAVGAEYSFFDLAYIRGGYTFNSLDRTFAAGLGLRLSLGFTEYTVDYTFRPLPDYGFVHSFSVSISF